MARGIRARKRLRATGKWRSVAAPSKGNEMNRSARLLLLCLAATGCGQHHGNIISIANSQGFETPANGTAPANGAEPAANAASNAAGNAQASAASHDRVLRTETVSGTFTGWEM